MPELGDPDQFEFHPIPKDLDLDEILDSHWIMALGT